MAKGSEVIVDREHGIQIINETDVPDDVVVHAITEQYPELASLVQWGQQTQSRAGTIFERDRYVTPASIFQQIRVAKDASANDDVVSGVIETTEALAFSGVRMECDDEDEEDVWNQILDDIEMTTRAHEMWRELFTVSQYYVATFWSRKSYKVRGKTKDGNKKKKEFKDLLVPTGVTILDPLKVVPVGNFMFGQEQLAYIAEKSEIQPIETTLAGENSSDLVIAQLLTGKYTPGESEKKLLKDVTGQRNVENLFLLNPKTVYRHTSTRPAYQRFADVRLKSVFEILDKKQQLSQMDRAHLIGGTSFIVLVKRGSDARPATQGEVNATATQVKMAARVPVIISDHRIEIEIITPNTDLTLTPEKYNTLDARIAARLYQMFMTGNYAAGAKGDDSIKLARIVAKGMEARRNAIGDMFFRKVLSRIYEENDSLTEKPELLFSPKRIALDFDPNVLAFLQELRDRGDLSRHTILGEMDIDQDAEMRHRKREKEKFDDTFKPPMAMLAPGAPGGPPAPPLPPAGAVGGKSPGGKSAGRSGGRKGGTNPKSAVSKPPRGPAKGPTSKKAKATTEYETARELFRGMSDDEFDELVEEYSEFLDD